MTKYASVCAHPHFAQQKNNPTAAKQSRHNGITDIKVTTCPEDNCSIPGFRKIPQDLNKYSRGNYVHLHFTDSQHSSHQPHEQVNIVDLGTHDSPMIQATAQLLNNKKNKHDNPITQIAVLQGQDADMGADWEKIEGNLNDGTYGPVLTMFVRRDPTQSPIDSIVIKYGFDSHAAIGYDRLPMDLNTGTGTFFFCNVTTGREMPIWLCYDHDTFAFFAFAAFFLNCFGLCKLCVFFFSSTNCLKKGTNVIFFLHGWLIHSQAVSGSIFSIRGQVPVNQSHTSPPKHASSPPAAWTAAGHASTGRL